MKRTFIPLKSMILLEKFRETKREYKLLPESLLLDYILEEVAKKEGIDLKTEPSPDNVDKGAFLSMVRVSEGQMKADEFS